ncbi:MAG TPA: hypothetical protein VIL97_02625 [Thermoanaerobaculia bacterium]
MHRSVWLFSISLFFAATLHAHEGHAHQLLGTVERVRDCHFVIKTSTGEVKTIFPSASTKYERAGQPATKQDVVSGARVSVTVENDGETATAVKIGGAK